MMPRLLQPVSPKTASSCWPPAPSPTVPPSPAARRSAPPSPSASPLSPTSSGTTAATGIFGLKALSEWRVTGTLPDGKKLDCLGCDLWEFTPDGEVAKKDTYYKQVTG